MTISPVLSFQRAPEGLTGLRLQVGHDIMPNGLKPIPQKHSTTSHFIQNLGCRALYSLLSKNSFFANFDDTSKAKKMIGRSLVQETHWAIDTPSKSSVI